MMGSLFSSISGLKNHSTWMSVIGNNISNVNTVGFKQQRITFTSAISQAMGAASGANSAANVGGINPIQLGLGSTLGSIDNIMTQGAIQTTGNALDIAIQGSGFFAVKSGDSTYYTRAGNFNQDSAGNVVTSNGYIMQGWMGEVERTINAASTNPTNQISGANYNIDTNQTAGNINIPSDLTLQAQATSEITFAGNLDSLTGITQLNPAVTTAGVLPFGADYQNTGATTTLAGVNGTNTFFVDATGVTVTPDATASQVVYDSLGNSKTITIWFFQAADLNAAGPLANRPAWQWYAFDTTTASPSYLNCLGGSGIEDAGAALQGNTGAAYANSLIWFNPDGSLASNGGQRQVANATANPINAAMTQPTIVFPWVDQAQGQFNDGSIGDQMVTLDFGTSNQWNIPAGGGAIQVNTATNSGVASANYYGLRDGLTGDVSGSYQTVGGVTTYIPDQSVYGKSNDGYAAGSLVGLSVDASGNINGQFSNDQIISLATVAVATFLNPQGLANVGDTMYAATSNSGDPRLTQASTVGSALTGGALEASNVDLSVELTNMILAQRGFDSNARIVTTSSDMLDTLVNLGR